MHYTAKNVVYGLVWMKLLAGALKVAPADPLIDTAKVRLSKDPDFALNKNTVIEDLEDNEADFSGYAAGGVALTVGTAVNIGTSQAGTQAPVTFTAAAADPFVTGTVYGWWIDDTVNFICGERLTAPLVFQFNAPGDYLQLDVITPFPLTVTVDN